MGYTDVIAGAIGESEGGEACDHWNADTANTVLQHLTKAGFAIVPTEIPMKIFAALLDDYDERSRAGQPTQSYRDIWSVALKSAKALA